MTFLCLFDFEVEIDLDFHVDVDFEVATFRDRYHWQ